MEEWVISCPVNDLLYEPSPRPRSLPSPMLGRGDGVRAGYRNCLYGHDMRQIQQWLQQGTQIYFFVHCPIEELSPSTARYFQTLLEQNGVAVPPLPWNNLDHPPNQLTLW